MTDTDPRFPESERPNLRRAIADLEDAHIAGRRPDLAALAPAGPWCVPYLLALIPYDMAYRLRAGDRDGSAVGAYLAAFPDLARDPDAVARLVQEEHDARRAAGPVNAVGETVEVDPRSRFAYRDRFPDLWPRLFTYADATRLPEPGERIGDWYRVGRQVGRGGMAVVFECRDERLGRTVALKILDPEGPHFRDPTFRERFLREARALANVDHRNVVRVHAAGLVGAGREVPYFVMDFIAGEPLDRRFDAVGKLDPAEVVRVGAGIAAGLVAIHAAGLVHRDVNPRNVVLRPDGTPVLLDLGLARSDGAPQLTEAGVVMGTAHYMSPEQANGAAVDCRTDLFSLGCILFRAVTGRLPFPGDSLAEVLPRVRDENPPSVESLAPETPRALADLITRLLAKEPDARPRSAEEVVAEFGAITAGSANGVSPRRTERSRRRRVWWACGLVTVAGVVALALVYGGNRDVPNYRGRIDAHIHRRGVLVDLLHPDALPLAVGDRFNVSATIDPPAYLYVFWIEPDGEASPLYPWDPKVGWGSRPGSEKPVGQVWLPEGGDFQPDPKKPLTGVTTLVAFAHPQRLRLSEEEIRSWFEMLPPLERAKDDTRAVVWFDNYAPLGRGDSRAPVVVGSIDPYARWQSELKKRVGGAAAFQTAASFARGRE